MSTPVVVAATVVAVALAALGGLSTALHRRIGSAHLVAAGLLEALLVVQGVLAVVRVAGGHRPAELATFVAYLSSVVLLPVAGAAGASGDAAREPGATRVARRLIPHRCRHLLVVVPAPSSAHSAACTDDTGGSGRQGPDARHPASPDAAGSPQPNSGPPWWCVA